MERHIVEILAILIREYPEGAITPDDFEPIANNLIGLGYTQQEIETALYWFYNRQELRQHSKPDDQFGRDSFRFLHDAERQIISPEAYGYLIELQQLGLINLTEMDTIIERAVLLGGRRIDANEMKMFIAAFIMEQYSQFSPAMQTVMFKTSSEKVH